MTAHSRPMPDHLAAEIAARVDYTRLPRRVRLVTPPPPGWPGGHLERVGAWCAGRIRRRAETEEGES